MPEYKEIINKIKENKKIKTVLILLFAGILLITFSKSPEKKEEIKSTYEEEILISRKETEEQLKKLLLSIDGVKKVEVMISFSDMGIKEYYKDETEDFNESKSKTDKKIVFKKYEGNEIPVLKREIYPEIKGVTVVADCVLKNADELIFKAVKGSLGTDSHKIEIIINDRSK